MTKQESRGTIILTMLFLGAVFAQCGRPMHVRAMADACGGLNHPVTIGGAMVIGCR